MSRLGHYGRFTSHLFAGLLALSLTSLAVPRPAQAQDDPTRAAARDAFQGGVAAYDAGHYQAALEHFQEAYRLLPNPTVRVNMASCYEQLDLPLQAIDHFERFLVEAGNDAPRDQVREVRAALRRLHARVGEVFVRVEPDGATVVIDHGDSRRAPILDAIPMTAGGHHFEVRMEGYRTVERDIVVDGGGRAEVEVSLEQGVDAAPAVGSGGADDVAAPNPDGGLAETNPLVEQPAEHEAGGGLGLSTPVLVAGSATIGMGLIALGTGIAALRANSDYDAAVTAFQNSPRGTTAHVQAQQDGLAAKDRANRLATATDVFLVATLAGAGVTAYFLFFYDDDEDDQVTATPVVSPEAAGVVLSGRF